MTDRLPKTVVLNAVRSACSPWSAYINDEVQRWHAKNGTGHTPTSQLILRRLRSLVADGHLTQSPLRRGYYGFRWTITEAGKAALWFAGYGGL
jgi:hypothetical protein